MLIENFKNRLKKCLFGYNDFLEEEKTIRYLLDSNIFDNYEQTYDYFYKNVINDSQTSSLLARYLCEGRLNRKEANTVYSKKIEEIDVAKIESSSWNRLRIIFEMNGLLYASHIFRDKCKEKILNSKTIFNIFGKLLCMIENGEIERVDRLSKRVFFRLLCMIFGLTDLVKYVKLLKREIYICDNYYSFLKNKNIYLIGPCSNDIKKVYNFNKKDIVVMFTYEISKSLPLGIENVNISYYNGENTKQIVDTQSKNLLTKLDYICTKDKSISSSNRVRKINTLKYVMPFGGANMAQLFLIDLLHYDCKKIMINDINVSITKNMYNKDYFRKTSDNGERVKTYAMHDIEGNFLLLQMMYNLKVFECDETLESILKMTPEEYMRTLERNIYDY